MAEAGENLGQPRSESHGGSTGGWTASGAEEFFLGLRDTPFVNPRSLPITSENQNILLDQLMVYLSKGLEGFNSGITQFNEQAPGMTNLQAASLSGLEGIARGESGTFRMPEVQSALASLQNILSGGPASFEDYFNKAVAAPAQTELRRAMDELAAQAVGSGNLFGSERTKANSLAVSEFLRVLEAERAKFAYDAFNQNRQDVMQAAGLIPGLAEQGLNIGERLFNIGGQERQVGMEQFEARRQEAIRQEQIRQFLLELMLGAGTRPTYGVAGGFGLPQAGDTGGGFVGGLLSI